MGKSKHLPNKNGLQPWWIKLVSTRTRQHPTKTNHGDGMTTLVPTGPCGIVSGQGYCFCCVDSSNVCTREEEGDLSQAADFNAGVAGT